MVFISLQVIATELFCEQVTSQQYTMYQNWTTYKYTKRRLSATAVLHLIKIVLFKLCYVLD